MRTRDYYDELEARLESILFAVGSSLSGEEVDEVRQFVDAGEYGLALETLVDLLVEEKKTISRSVYEDIVQTANRMEIREQINTALETCVSDS